MVDWDLSSRIRWRSQSRRSLGSGFIDFNPVGRFPRGLLGFLLGSQISSRFPFTGLSLRSSTTSSSWWFIGRLTARRPGRDWHGQNWDVSFKPKDWGDKAIHGLHPIRQVVRFWEVNKISYDEGTLLGPFYPNMAGVHQLISRPVGGILEHPL
jgi:hypothetical protein